MTEYDDFNSGELYLLFDNDIYASLDLPFMVSASVEETEKVKKALNMLYIEGYPSPGCLSSIKDSNQCLMNSYNRLRIPGNQIL